MDCGSVDFNFQYSRGRFAVRVEAVDIRVTMMIGKLLLVSFAVLLGDGENTAKDEGVLDKLFAKKRPDALLAKAAKDKARVLPMGTVPDDERVETTRGTRDPYHPWTPPADLASWSRRQQELRTQMLVATGLWPMPERTPMDPVIHGKVDKGDYTVERVYLQSYPGHFVTGNLYRPKGKTGRLPAVLSPHGHWQNGRMYDAQEKETKNQLAQGAESHYMNARHPLQARVASLARMGCVVFHYDMVGYADSKSIPHSSGFLDVEAVLRLQSFMGLQTWNSIRALDFLLGLEDVDPTRVAVTGASGGGTQTFMLCALDDRPAVAFPAVMVSASMQGGCVCENCPLLRVGTTNVEFAAMTAPRPCGMTAANDWTRDMETKGLPELKHIYGLFHVPNNVMLAPYLQFGHNYNQVSRETMYGWLNRHLALGVPDVGERPIDPIAPANLSVFNDEHPLPSDAKSAADLRDYLTRSWDAEFSKRQPVDPASFHRYRELVGPALCSMIVDAFPSGDEIEVRDLGTVHMPEYSVDRLVLARRRRELTFPREAIPTAVYMPKNWTGRMVAWIDAEGHANLTAPETGEPIVAVTDLLASGTAVLAPDVFLTGEYHDKDTYVPSPPVDKVYSGYTSCYNRTTLANRVHDILTAIGCAKHLYGASAIDLVGFEEAGPWVILAKGVAGAMVRRTAADMNDFSFTKVKSPNDPMLIPGALKYGDLVGFAMLCAPDDLYLMGADTAPGKEGARLAEVYEISGNPIGLVVKSMEERDVAAALRWLAR